MKVRSLEALIMEIVVPGALGRAEKTLTLAETITNMTTINLVNFIPAPPYK
jgi:hypothetical protein